MKREIICKTCHVKDLYQDKRTRVLRDTYFRLTEDTKVSMRFGAALSYYNCDWCNDKISAGDNCRVMASVPRDSVKYPNLVWADDYIGSVKEEESFENLMKDL